MGCVNRYVLIVARTGGTMMMEVGQSYRCINPNCRCKIEVTEPSTESVFNLRCCCGAEMKKPYTKPALKLPSVEPEVFAMQKARK
jgi:hypothetical protein